MESNPAHFKTNAMSEIKKITGEEPANPTGLWGQQQTAGMNLRTWIAAQIHASSVQVAYSNDIAIGADVSVFEADKLIEALNKIPNPNK